jgi:hypothetical protein
MKWRRLRWAEHVARVVEKRNAYRSLVGRHEVRNQLGGLKPRLEDNIKINLKNKWDGKPWTELSGPE